MLHPLLAGVSHRTLLLKGATLEVGASGALRQQHGLVSARFSPHLPYSSASLLFIQVLVKIDRILSCVK